MDIQKNVVLAPYTTFHIGGPADYFVKVTSSNELMDAVMYAKEKNLPFFVLGTGANILVGDKGFRGLVIKNESKQLQIANSKWQIDQGVTRVGGPHRAPATSLRVKPSDEGDERQDPDKVYLTTDSGTTIEELISFTKEKGLSGFEHFAGIPSSVGGALWQNLHFLSPDRNRTVYIGEILENAEIIPSSKFTVHSSQKSTNNHEPITMNVDRDYFKFDYDYSILHDTHDIVLSAKFRLSEKPKDEIEKTIEENLRWRKEKHPENAANCSAGSIFKKIKDHGAGRLIERVGLKGYSIGKAQISPRHANFIVNNGGASAKNVRDLIELVQKKVSEELGLEMKVEISFVGEF